MLKTFKNFRYTRPFWAGLFTMFGGFVTALLPFGPLDYFLHAGIGAWAGVLLGLANMGLGFLMWLAPKHRHTLGLLAVVVALVSFPMSNLGGLVIGMIAGILGGSMAFGWMPEKPSDRIPEGEPVFGENVPPPGEPMPELESETVPVPIGAGSYFFESQNR